MSQPTTDQRAKAMILAAGRGQRMRPLTDQCPKPLLKVGAKPLIQRHIEALARKGFIHQLLNTAWLADQLQQGLRDGSQFGAQLSYSMEAQDFGHALETAGGVIRAIPRLADCFWLVAGDVFVPEFEFDVSLYERFAASSELAHLWLVANPEHNPKGDFGISPAGKACNVSDNDAQVRWTYSTIGLFRQSFFSPERTGIPLGNPQGIKAALAPLLRRAMDEGVVSAEIYPGPWTDVGTPERLAWLNRTN